MKVALDLQPCIGNMTGIGLYTHEIAKRLNSDDEITYHGEIFYFGNKEESRRLEQEYGFDVKACNKMPYGIYRRANRVLPMPYEMLFGKSDLHHFPNFIVPPNIKGHVITAIHDLTYLRYPEAVAKRTYDHLKTGIDYSIKRSDLILTVSEFVRGEIIELLGVEEDRVIAIHNGPSISEAEVPMEAVRTKYSIKDKPYILYLGTIEPRKNLVRLIQAYNILRENKELDYQLVLAGGKGWSCDDIYAEAKASPYAEDIVFTDYITTEEKTALYKHASLFVFPSIYEGFGIPLLEAMHFKTPVLTSNVSSMPEVTGDAAELVDPFHVEDIAEGMKHVLSDTTYQQELIEKGTIRMQHFDWDKAAMQVKDVHRRFL